MTTDRLLSFPPRPDAASTGDGALLGPSPAIARVWSQLHRVAPHFRAAIVTGEHGSGTEAVARSLHALSPASTLPFRSLSLAEAERVFVTSSTLPPECDGFLFLREVDALSTAAQRGLLRRLRNRARGPFRVVAAPRHEFRASVSAGRFLPELAEMLGTVRILMPPLRERRLDIPLLATHMVQAVAQRLGLPTPILTPAFHQAMDTFLWPGNLAQMQQVFEHLLTDRQAEAYTAEDFDTAARSATAAPSTPTPPPVRMVRLDDVVQEHIRAVLIGCHGNKLKAAEVLGISRSTLYRMLDGAPPQSPYSMAG